MLTKTNNLILAFALFVAFIFAPQTSSAQEIDTLKVEPVEKIAPEGYEYVDSLVVVRVPQVDSTYVGVDVFDLDINQSEAIASSMRSHIEANPSRTISGYRVRIFFDNKQTARVESENSLKKFEKMFPEIYAYRTYTNPYFKVTVGDCRTKSEAMALLGRIKRDFPSAFVVKENIFYPAVSDEPSFRTDTLQVLRPIKLQ